MTDRAPSPPVLCFGEILVDLIVADGATRLEDATSLAVQPGGAPANVAVGLAKLGVPSAFCGVVGADPFGAKLKAAMVGYGVDITRVRTAEDAATTIALAWKDTGGDGHFQILRMADATLSVDDATRAGIDAAQALVVGSVSLTAQPSRSAVEQAVALARSAGVPVCFDVNIRPSLWKSRDEARQACEPLLHDALLIKVSRDDVAYLLGEDLDPQATIANVDPQGDKFVVVTDGARGAWYLDRAGPAAHLRHIPAWPIDAVDPTGAGDGFTAGLIARLQSRKWAKLDDADIRYASAAGALTAMGRGAMASLPLAATINAFLDHHRNGRPNP